MAVSSARAGALAALRRVLDDGDIHPVYQPIVDLNTGKVVGLEALARGPAESPVEFPDALFSAAAQAGLLPETAMLCAARAIQLAREARVRLPPLLFVNSEPATLHYPLSADLAAALKGPLPFRIVLEFTERAMSTHPGALLSIAEHVHERGNCLALDDVGAEPMSLALLPFIDPEVIKLDRALLHQLDGATMDTVGVASAFAERSGAILLSEGIETERDLATARALGARWGQGWLFGRPTSLECAGHYAIDAESSLRPSRSQFHRPSGTPFALAAAHRDPRRGTTEQIHAWIEYVLEETAHARHAVLLGFTTSPRIASVLLPRFAALAPVCDLAGLVAPHPTSPGATGPLRLAVPPPGFPPRETLLTLVSPQSNVALCLRQSDPDGTQDTYDFVLTQDPEVVRALARITLSGIGLIEA